MFPGVVRTDPHTHSNLFFYCYSRRLGVVYCRALCGLLLHSLLCLISNRKQNSFHCNRQCIKNRFFSSKTTMVVVANRNRQWPHITSMSHHLHDWNLDKSYPLNLSSNIFFPAQIAVVLLYWQELLCLRFPLVLALLRVHLPRHLILRIWCRTLLQNC